MALVLLPSPASCLRLWNARVIGVCHQVPPVLPSSDKEVFIPSHLVSGVPLCVARGGLVLMRKAWASFISATY